MKAKSLLSLSTSAYCQARNKLKDLCLNDILQGRWRTLQSIDNTHGGRVIVVDGTELRIPDTKKSGELLNYELKKEP